MHQQIKEVLPEAQHTNSPLNQTAKNILYRIERESTSWANPVCTRCMLRCTEYRSPITSHEAIVYQGCRECRQSQDIATGEVIAILDATLNQLWTTTNNGLIKVNWLQWRAVFDFDRVEIINATDEDVERLSMQIGNDTDKVRSPRYQQITCTISPGCHLSENTLRILHRTFGEVVQL